MLKKTNVSVFKLLAYNSPLIFLILGYICASFLYKREEIPMPALVGKTIAQAAELLAETQLSLRIVNFQENPNMPDACVLNQVPQPDTPIFVQQTVLLTINKRAAPELTPQVVLHTQENAQTILKSHKLTPIFIPVISSYPDHWCIAQLPESGSQAPQSKKILLYISDKQHDWVLFPALLGKKVSDIQQFFKLYDAHITLLHTTPQPDTHRCTDCVVLKQKPSAGTCIDLKKPILLQLQVTIP